MDAVLIAWLALGAVRGALAGLYRTGFRLAGLVLSLVLSVRFSGDAAAWLAARTALDDMLRRFAAGVLPLSPDVARLPARDALEAMGGLNQEMAHVPGLVLPAAAPGATLGEYLGEALVTVTLNLVAFVGILVVVNGLAHMAGALIQATIGRLPVLGTLNRAGGGFLGLTQTTVVAAVAVGLLQPLARILWPAQTSALAASSRLLVPLQKLYGFLVALTGL